MKEEKKLNMEKVKQVVLIGIAVILLGVGFANYEPSSNSNQQMAIVQNEDMIGDVQLVSSNAVVENENVIFLLLESIFISIFCLSSFESFLLENSNIDIAYQPS